MVANYDGGMKEHWRFFVAMTLVSASTFQYGLDFGVINGLQAMVPFLAVCSSVRGATGRRARLARPSLKC